MTTTIYTKSGADDSFRAGSVCFEEERFAGVNDDATLTNIMSYAAAQTYPPTIQFINRAYSFATQRTPYTGMRLRGPLMGQGNPELAPANVQCDLNLSTNGPWMNVPSGGVFDCFIGGMCFNGTANTTFLGSTSSGLWHGSMLRDLTFQNFLSVLGTQSAKQNMTTCVIDGWFQTQGTYNGAVHIGGSDNFLFMGGWLADSSRTYNASGNAVGQAHFWADGLDNTKVGHLYFTAEGPWISLRFSGSAYNAGGPPGNLGMCIFDSPIFEGGDANSKAGDGCQIRMEGGQLRIVGGYIGRAMVDPSSMSGTSGHSPIDAGTIHQTGGQLGMWGVTYDRATVVAETVPFVYQSGGWATIKDTFIATKGGTWSGRPRVQSAGGTMYLDESVTPVNTGGTMRQYQTVAV